MNFRVAGSFQIFSMKSSSLEQLRTSNPSSHPLVPSQKEQGKYLSIHQIEDNKIEFNLIVKKNDDKKIDKFINKIVSNFKITKYKYKKIEEIKLEDNDEL